ncbi:MAG: hypothetical protein AB1752_11890 [Candidatus Zixiibacteriota bacterium]
MPDNFAPHRLSLAARSGSSRRFRISAPTLLFTASILLGLSHPGLAGPITVSPQGASGYPSQQILIPVEVSIESDTVAGYMLEYSMDRPGVVEFLQETIVETLIVCNDPPLCTVADTTIDTVSRVPAEAAGTLSGGWEFIAAVNLGSPTFLRLTAVADLNGGATTPPLSPPQSGELLIYLVGEIPCHVDPFSGQTANLIPIKADFSDNHGQLLAPVTSNGATLIVLDPVPGDFNLSGMVDAVDLAGFIDCIYFGGCPDCDAIPTDFDCDGFATAVDLARLIDHVFFGAAAPAACGP